ncbi:MAG: His/Gly/Thr/Pro-type tRNA ligase C-terminal domain-containing protein, partial [Actinomycetota bacterium]
VVSAMSGAMGGSASEEFLFPCESGEDTFVSCSKCDYAANTEAVRVGEPAKIDFSKTAAAVVHDTPATPTIATLVDLFNGRTDLKRADRAWQAADTLKNVVVNLRHPDGRIEPLAVGVPGDRDVDLKRLEAQVAPAEIIDFTDEDFAKNKNLVKGYIGPTSLGEKNPSGIRYLLDRSIAVGSAWITGANAPGRHVANLVYGRDFSCDGVVDAAEVRDDDPCPKCGSHLRIRRGIEIGHVFQLGRKYAEALDLTVLDQNGKTQVVTMGSYGIGVSRAVAAIAEANHDELGLKWPTAVAPADAHVVIAGKPGDDTTEAAEKIAAALSAKNLTVILDDRKGVSPGVRFKDAELIGAPRIVIAGRGVATGVVEVRDRRAGTASEISLKDAADFVAKMPAS